MSHHQHCSLPIIII